MRAVDVDFARPREIPRWMRALVLSAFAIVIGWQVRHIVQLQRQLASVRAEVKSLDAQIEAARAQRKEREGRAAQAAQSPEARMLAAIETFPLNDVLTGVESSRTEGIRLNLLDIAAADGVVRIECEYDKIDSVLRYVDKLNESSKTVRWQVTQLQSAKQENSGAGVATVIARVVGSRR